MTSEAETLKGAEAAGVRRHWLARVPWGMVLLVSVVVLLGVDRWRYLRTFGFVYTDGDQSTFWYQAWDVSRGIFREPCLYGQAYNVAVEAWVAAPLMVVGVPASVALPVVTVGLALLPFLVLAGFAWRRGVRWGAVMILLVPVALPVEYVVVSSLPRGFVNGIAVGAVGVALWVFGRGKWAFFFSGMFSAAGLGVNPSCAIVLLAAGVFALLTHWREWRFYLFSAMGAVVGAVVPLGVWLFYRWHPACEVYSPKVGMGFLWGLLRSSIGKREMLDLFWGDLVPVVHRGWVMFLILGLMVGVLLVVRKWRGAVAVMAAGVMTVMALGDERVHSAWANVFYPGTRMFLAVPVVWGLGMCWVDEGLGAWRGRGGRVVAAVLRGVVIVGLGVCVLCRHTELLTSPSRFVTEAYLPPVERVDELQHDTAAVAAACEKYHADLVLLAPSAYTCLNDAGPVLAGGKIETLYPWFERRSFRVGEERVRKHTAVIVYLPGFWQTMTAGRVFPGSRLVSRSPTLLLIPIAAPGKSGMEVVEGIGLTYRPRI